MTKFLRHFKRVKIRSLSLILPLQVRIIRALCLLYMDVNQSFSPEFKMNETLKHLLEKLSALPDNAYDEIRSIFHQAYAIADTIIQSKTFFENQADVEACTKIAVQCCNKLLDQSSMDQKSLTYIEHTKNIFLRFPNRYKPDLHIMQIHNEFLDKVYGVEDDLGSLLKESIKNSTRVEQAPQPKLQDKAPEQASKKVTGESYGALNTQWKKLAGKHGSKSIVDEIADLSKQISKKAHEDRREAPSPEKNELFTLGLAVEARHIEQMQQTNKPLQTISRSLKRSAQYFDGLSQYHRSHGEYDIAKEMQKQSTIASERADNLARIIACRNIIHSDLTTASDKVRAIARERRFRSELCYQPQELRGGDETVTSIVDHTSGEIPMSEKMRILEEVKVKNSNPFFELYVTAKSHINDVEFELLKEIHYDQPILICNPLDADHEQEVPLEVQDNLFRLLQSEAGERLQSAIQFFYLTECKYYESVTDIPGSDESIETIRFRAEFQQEAYAKLFARYTSPTQLENPELFAQDCRDILNTETYTTPLLNVMARHQLALLGAQNPVVPTHVEDEPKAEDSPSQKVRDRRYKPGAKKANTTVEDTPPLHEDETLLEQISSAQQIHVVDFNSEITKLERDKAFSEETANKLYAIITDPLYPLAVNTQNVGTFYTLYCEVFDYFKSKEKGDLKQHLRTCANNAELDAPIPERKLLEKSLNILRGMLRYEALLSPQQKADLLYYLADTCVYIRKLGTSAKFKQEGIEAFTKLSDVIRDFPDDIESHLYDFDLATTVTQLTPASNQTAIQSARMSAYTARGEEEHQKFESIAASVRAKALTPESRHQAMLENAKHQTFLIDAVEMIRFGREPRNISAQEPMLRQLRNTLDTYGSTFNEHTRVLMENIYYKLEDVDHLETAWLIENYTYLLTGYVTINERVETAKFLEELGFPNERHLEYESFVNNIANYLKELYKRMSESSSVVPVAVHTEKDLDRSFFKPVDIPELLIKAIEKKDKNSPANEMLAHIKKNQYLKAMAISREDSAARCEQVTFLRACLLKWVLQVMDTDTFKSFLNKDETITNSFEETKKELEALRIELLRSAKSKFESAAKSAKKRKDTSTSNKLSDLGKQCKKEIEKKWSSTEMETPLRALSVFATDEKSSEGEATITLSPQTFH